MPGASGIWPLWFRRKFDIFHIPTNLLLKSPIYHP